MAGKRKVPEINSSSTADIAFLLLVFFLMTTTMAVNKGLVRRLPPMPEQQQKTEHLKVNERNVLVVLLNDANMLMVNGERMNTEGLGTKLNTELKDKAKEFIKNEARAEDKPVITDTIIAGVGTIPMSKDHVISLQNDRETSYSMYILVQSELVAAYNELRDEFSMSRWNLKYSELTEDQQKIVQLVYPQKISEAEPMNYGKKDGGTK